MKDVAKAAERVRGIVMEDPVESVNHAADLVVQSRHHLAKASTRRNSIDPFGEIGTTGLRQFGGFVLEEWLAQLAGRKAAWVWREMLDNDPVIGAVMFAIRMLARGVEWRVDEGGNSEAAELVETSMHDMSHTWNDFVSEAMSFLPYGWALHEEVFKVCRGQQPDGPILADDNAGDYTRENVGRKASSQYSDGKIRWRKLPIRAQETLLRWGFDGYSSISYMEQIDWHGGDHKIPIQKSLLFRTQTTRNSPEGRSILRNAYTSYFALKNIKALEGIGIERDLAGVPVATPPEGVDLFSPGQAALLKKVQQMVTALRRDEYEGIVLPSAGWDIKLMNTGGARQFDTDKVVRRYRQDLALSMLAEFVLVGQDALGSYAMVEVKSDLFGVALDGVLDLICEVMNRYAIPRLLRLNGIDASEPPRICHSSARRVDLERVGGFLQAISLAGAPIPWSVELLRALFSDAGLPANFEDQASPDKLPNAPKPDEQESLQGERAVAEQERADRTGDNQTVEKAERRETSDGTVVDLSEHLRSHHAALSRQLERELAGALAELGERAASAYQATVTKARVPGASTVHRLVSRVLSAVNLQAWIQGRLLPLLRNHAARVTTDVQRVIQTEVDLEVGVADEAAERIADQAGEHLGIRDIQPQLRAAILQAVRDGVAAGENPTKTAQRIRDLVPAGRFVHAGSAYRSKLIAREETARAMRAASLAAYESNPRITGVELRDGIYGPPRSDAVCIERDGDVVPIEEASAVHAEHPQCTLSFSPVVAGTLEPTPELIAA